MKKDFRDLPIFGLIVPVIILTIWQLTGLSGNINTTILPLPSKLFTTLLEIIKDGSLVKNILVSLRRVFSGYLIGASLGVLLGVFMGLSKTFSKLFGMILEIIRPIPILAWVPVLILWSGISETSKVITIAIGSFWSVLLNTMDGVRNVDGKYKEVAAILNKRKIDTVLSVSLPGALPSIFTGLRIGIGSAWLSVIGAEMIAASSGLGYFINYSREMMKPAKMFVGVFVIGFIGWLINSFIRWAEKKLLRWNS